MALIWKIIEHFFAILKPLDSVMNVHHALFILTKSTLL